MTSKTYFTYCGIEMYEVTSFVTMLIENSISFEYDCERGVFTVKYCDIKHIKEIDLFIKENDFDIHDTEEEY